MFASVPNFSDFYSEMEGNKQGVGCMIVLNEIISDFDEVIIILKFFQIKNIAFN